MIKKQIFSITLIISLFSLISCNSNSQANHEDLPTFDFSTKEGVKNYIVSTKWNQWDGALVFKNDGTCNFFKKNLRTEQVEWNINGTFVVDKSKFEDNGGSYWYVKANWQQQGIINDFYTIYDGHLVEPDGVYFDSYGPVLKSWKSEGGLVLDRNKIFPITP